MGHAGRHSCAPVRWSTCTDCLVKRPALRVGEEERNALEDATVAFARQLPPVCCYAT
jgi:hypothetical protein